MHRVAIALIVLSSSAFAAPFEKPLGAPRAFDGIRAGMAVADAKLAGWQPDASYKDGANRTRLVKDAGGGAKYYVLVAGDTVSRIGVEAPAQGLVPKLEKLWGKATRATNLASESLTSWSTASWRVDLACRGELCRLAFHEPLAPAFFGAAPQAPGALASLRPGMTKAELQKLSPRHLASDIPAGPEDVRVTVSLAKSGHVQGVVLAGLPANARALLDKAWGAATTTADGPTWFNADRGWRAVLHEDLALVQLTGYISAAKILGAGPGIALLAKPVLGAFREQILAAYPVQTRADGKKLVIELPPSEAGTGRVVVSFDTKNMRANKLAFELPYESEARRDELLKLMAMKWGTPANGAFPTKDVKISVADGANRLDLVIALP